MEKRKVKKDSHEAYIPLADLEWFLANGWELVKEEKEEKEVKPKQK